MRLVFIILILLGSIVIAGCGTALPECYKGVERVYFCDGGEKIKIFESGDYEVITIHDEKVHRCEKDSDIPPCDILKDTQYCPRIDYCDDPKWQRAT